MPEYPKLHWKHKCTWSPMKKLTYFIFIAQHVLTKQFCYIVTIYLSPFTSIQSNQIQAIVQLSDRKKKLKILEG